MRDDLPEDPLPEGRLLVESGELVAGSMSRTAAGLLFGAASAAVRLEDRWAACLRDAATSAAAVGAPRERMRAGAALAFATELVVTRTRQGRPVRDDGFFTPDGRRRSPADELAEAVVLAARRSTDERWVRHLGYLLGEVAVSPDVDAGLAGRALRTAAGLGWRQLALLAGVGRRDRVPLPMAPLSDEPRPWTAWGAREDVADLQRAGLLDPPVAAPRLGGAAQPRLRAADLRLTRRGVLLHRLLVLDFVRDDAVAAALADLGLPRS
ncbi:hypothetical protein OF117_21465 [Geodermatophilus sp. YIM 151500]|uniref:hypothetical protein n=1 Tax=Geodermatophilus sp. YIM 151500 TaxID=2984531 RepID=UPI0021E4C8F5|nr:hypothetical protein [Geodermatophilus sp. YIM 151500]MCV2491921.1 hypothetical protein [Geodermatophilus sp. YIM 151500]